MYYDLERRYVRQYIITSLLLVVESTDRDNDQYNDVTSVLSYVGPFCNGGQGDVALTVGSVPRRIVSKLRQSDSLKMSNQ